MIELARDQLSDARADIERAVTVASRSGDLQTIAPSLFTRAMVRLIDGRADEAVADLNELLTAGERLSIALGSSGELPALGWFAADLDRSGDIDAVLQDSSTRWTPVMRAIQAGDAATAADLLAEIGHRPAEAYARLRAGGEHLDRALGFYRSVGATRYIREAESLLPASAEGTRQT